MIIKALGVLLLASIVIGMVGAYVTVTYLSEDEGFFYE